MRTAEDPIALNGSHGEGGGALFRTALCLSALTQKPVSIDQIRGATRKPGLSAEDYAVLLALSLACGAECEAEIGDDKVVFQPLRLPRPIHFEHDIARSGSGRSPGSTVVAAQTLAPILARAGAYSTLTLLGETHNNNTLGFDAFELCTSAAHLAQGIGIYPHIHLAGFGFAGRGKVVVEIEPSEIVPVDWSSRGAVVAAGARVTACEVHSQAVADAVSTCLKALQDNGLGDHVDQIELAGPEPGLSIAFWIRFERGCGSASACWSRGGQIQDCIARAWDGLNSFIKSETTADPHLADQLLIPACLADGLTTYSTPNVTRRLKTMAWVIKQFLPIAITIKGTEGSRGVVSVQR